MLLSRFAHLFFAALVTSQQQTSKMSLGHTHTLQCSEVSPSPWQKSFTGYICIHYSSRGILNAADLRKQFKQVSFLKIFVLTFC